MSARNQVLADRPAHIPASRRRPWRLLATVATGVALVAATFAVTAQDREPARSLPSPGQRVTPPGERLVPLVMLKATGSRPGEAPPAPTLPLLEVLPEGQVAEVFSPTDDLVLDSVWPRGDGSLVAIGSRGARSVVLMVVGPDGRTVSTQDIRVPGEYVNLLGVTGNEAVLQRIAANSPAPRRIVARDLSTGEERELGVHSRTAGRGDVAAGRVVLAGGGVDDTTTVDQGTRCWVELFVPGTGVVDETSVPGCHQVVQVDASPAGRFAAVVYQRWNTPDELRMVTVDLSSTRVVTDELLGNPVDCTACRVSHSGFLGMAWQDDRRLRVVFMDPLPVDLEPELFLDGVEERLRFQYRTMPR